MQRRDLWLFFGICVICCFLMLPRILSAQFGLLDDARLLTDSQQTLADVRFVLYQFQEVGRFLPTALLFRMLTFSFAGFEPQRWYIVSTGILIIVCLEMAFLARRYGFSRLQGLLSVLFFVVSPTLIESFYTLSKSEIPLLLLIASALLLVTADSPSGSRLRRVWIVFFCSLLLTLSFGAKETAIVLPFLFSAWLLLSWLYFKKTGRYQHFIQTDVVLLFGSLLGCILYWVVRSHVGINSLSSYSGGYQLFNLEKLAINFKLLLGWLVRDYPYLLPLSLAILFVRPLRQANITFFTLRWLSWMGAWALILLPWNYLSYYLLPFSFGSALFAGMILGHMLTHLLPQREPRVKSNLDRPIARTANRNWFLLFCFLSFVLFIPPVANATAYATEQLMFDRANWKFLQRVIKLPKNSQLFVNLPLQEEYFYEISLFVDNIFNRSDISIQAYQPPIVFDRKHDVYLATPVFINQVLPRVRGLNGPSVIDWENCLEDIKDGSTEIFSTRLQRGVLDIGLHRLLAFLEDSDMIGKSERDVIVSQPLIYGWKLWKLPQPVADPARPAVYGGDTFFAQTPSGGFESIPFGEGTQTPLTGDVNGDGSSDLVIYNQHTGIWMVDHNLDGAADQNFTLTSMRADDIPLVGDWDGDGKDTFGFFRASASGWYLYNDISAQATEMYRFGESSDIPIVGDWDGDGIDETGVYRPSTGYTLLAIAPDEQDGNPSFTGPTDATPVAASWDGAKRDTLAFVKDNTWTIYPFNRECYPSNPLRSFQLEYDGIPLAIDS